MTVAAWRIVADRHRERVFSGEGARLAGGRWNSPGLPMVYCAANASLAMLEMLVNLDSPADLGRYVMFQAMIPRALVVDLDRRDLPAAWRSSPAPADLRTIGDRWVASGASAALRVPSAVMPVESNILLNVRHSAFPRIRLGPAEPLELDGRLASQLRR